MSLGYECAENSGTPDVNGLFSLLRLPGVTYQPKINHRIARRLDVFVYGCLTLVLTSSLAVVGGYVLHLSSLTRLHTGFQAMSVVTAFALGLLTLAMLAQKRDHRRIARSVAIVVAIITSGMIASHVFAGADVVSPLLEHHLFGPAAPATGRTSLATASCLLLLAASLLLQPYRDAWRTVVSDACACTTLVLGGLALMGYAYGVQELYSFRVFDTIALHTAADLLLLALALLLEPGRRWAAVIASDLAGGSVTRRQLAITSTMPLVGWVLLRSTEAGRVGPGMALALLVSLTVLSLTFLVLRDGRIQDLLDLERRSRADVLLRAQADLEHELQARAAALEDANTDRLRAEEALLRAQKMEAIGQLTGGVAHDFNNLLTVVVGALDMMMRRPGDVDRVKRLAQSAMTAAQRGEQLTQQLLAFSRRQMLRPQTLNPNRVLLDFKALAERAAGGAINLAFDLDPCVDPIHVDPTQFEAAVLNLVVNARDAMEGGANGASILVTSRNIHLSTHDVLGRGVPPGAYVTVAVVDVGGGIRPEIMSRVFEPFFTTKEIGKGSGLGLAQVYGFMRSAGGCVEIDTRVGEGTAVRLYFPRSAETLIDKISPTSATMPLRQASDGETVLLVEDDAEVLGMAVESLEELRYNVIVAHDAREALEHLHTTQRVDILFSDVMMPGGMNGTQLAAEARMIRPGLKVLLTSGYVASPEDSQTIARGEIAMLNKPYRRDELARSLRIVLRSKD